MTPEQKEIEKLKQSIDANLREADQELAEKDKIIKKLKNKIRSLELKIIRSFAK